MTIKSKLKDIEETFTECRSHWSGWMSNAELDDRIYLGDQWDGTDANKLINENRPVLSINLCKKPVDLVTGYQRQNRTQIKVFPVEGADQATADIYSEVIKWLMTDRAANHNVSYAFDDAVKTGLGWLCAEVEYTDDLLHGDIVLKLEDKYRIMPDPYFRDPKLSDCDYILRNAYMFKQKAKKLYPKFAKRIDKLESTPASQYSYMIEPHYNDKIQRVHVVEKWYRVYEEAVLLIDKQTGQSEEWEGTKERLEAILEAKPEMFENKYIMQYKVQKIKLMTSINDQLLVYDGDPPEGYSKTKFPFVPLFGYYTPNFNDWGLKLHGLVRPLRDSQKELNKSRSLLMDAMMSQTQSGWIMDKQAVDDLSTLMHGGAGKIIEKNPGKELIPIVPPPIHSALAQLEEMHKHDMISMGPNPDLLGMVGQGGSSADAPGISLQLRQKQGLTSLQVLFDNLTISYKMLGKLFIEYINEWPVTKIERIIGRPVPPNWEQVKKQARYDCTIDETADTPTYRATIQAQVQGYLQHGIQVPPQVLREISDIPQTVKETWQQIEQSQQQSQQQLQQAQLQIEMQKIQAMQAGPIQEKQMDVMSKKELETMKAQVDIRLKQMDIDGKIAIEQMKQSNDK